jgi:hypothetical protein
MDIKQRCREVIAWHGQGTLDEAEAREFATAALAEIERWEEKGDRVRRLALAARGIVSLDKKERALNAIYDLLAGEAHP